jgi:NTP pyrophosphatase (non-canonical NTP hydrolase)
MDTFDYETWQHEMARYPIDKPDLGGLHYTVLALVGEAGEVANRLKKIIRDEGGEVSVAAKYDLLLELGDVQWYLSACAKELNSSLDQVMELNIEKINARGYQSADRKINETF